MARNALLILLQNSYMMNFERNIDIMMNRKGKIIKIYIFFYIFAHHNDIYHIFAQSHFYAFVVTA